MNRAFSAGFCACVSWGVAGRCPERCPKLVMKQRRWRSTNASPGLWR
jgi:ribosome modulation factor